MTISIFDNHNTEDDVTGVPSRGLLLNVTLPPDNSIPPGVVGHTGSSAGNTISKAQGSYDASLRNRNQLMGYGPVPVVREFSPDGELLWEAWFGTDDKAQSYRSFKHEWHATPKGWDPVLVIEEENVLANREDKRKEKQPGSALIGYVSWNGATDVYSWNVYAVQQDDTEVLLGTALKNGFETEFYLSANRLVQFDVTDRRCILVAAVQDRAEIRKSNTVCI
jgi:hypothetical protein